MPDLKEVALSKLNVFGTFQTLQLFYICLPVFMAAMTHVNYIFVAEDVNYRCLLPECESEKPTVKRPTWWPEDVDTKCSKLVVVNTSADTVCSNETVFEIVGECHEWVYENNYSMVSDFNLGCQSWKSTLVGCIHNSGMIVSMIFTGWIADKFGRKPTAIICSIGGCIGVVKVFLTNYYAYLAVEFMESVMVSGLYSVAVVLMIEVGGDTKRVLTGVIFSYAIYFGEVAFAIIALSFKYWKSIVLVVYSPLILFITYALILKESPRWQILRGKIDEVKETLKFTARINKIDITAEEIDNASGNDLRTELNIEEQTEKENMKVIFQSKEIMTRLLVVSFCLFTSSFLYYGSVVHSVLLPGNKYTNFVLAALTSFPGDLLAYFTFEKFGRKVTLRCGYMFSAVFFVAQNYTPESMNWLKVILFLIGKLGIVICFTGVYTYSLELFPTSVRGSLFGWGNIAARIGGMLAPLTPLLMVELKALPTILFSSMAVISGLLLSFTPETKSLPLFDTIAQIEASIK